MTEAVLLGILLVSLAGVMVWIHQTTLDDDENENENEDDADT